MTEAYPRPPNAEHIYKIMPRTMWEAASSNGLFVGSELDIKDGFIHISQAHQVPRTLAKFYSGQTDLVILKISVAAVDQYVKSSNLPVDSFRFEFGGAKPEVGAGFELMFAHLYVPMPISLVEEVIIVTQGPDGTHITPSL